MIQDHYSFKLVYLFVKTKEVACSYLFLFLLFGVRRRMASFIRGLESWRRKNKIVYGARRIIAHNYRCLFWGLEKRWSLHEAEWEEGNLGWSPATSNVTSRWVHPLFPGMDSAVPQTFTQALGATSCLALAHRHHTQASTLVGRFRSCSHGCA